MLDQISKHLQYQQDALNLRAYRQQVLASNLANVDTPNYKARDFDFASTLKSAMAGRQGGDLPLAQTSSAHLSGSGAGAPVRLMYRVPSQGSVDGNMVEMDIERGQFSENAVQYEAGLTFITHQIKLLNAALQS